MVAQPCSHCWAIGSHLELSSFFFFFFGAESDLLVAVADECDNVHI